MFITKCRGKYTVWQNDEKSDWLKYVPMHFDCEKEEIDLFFVAKPHRKQLTEEMKIGLELSISGNMCMGQRRLAQGAPLEDVMSFEVKPITAWPYDESERFIGFSELG